ELLDENKIPYEERAKGQLFAKDAQEIVRFLVKRAKQANTDFSLATQVLAIQKTELGFLIRTSGGTLQAEHVVLATGGLSYPCLGASSFGLQLAQKFGLHITEQRPALCGLTFPKEMRKTYKILAGNSVLAAVQTGKHLFTDQLLFTHEGISGPAVLSTSLYWQEGHPVQVNFLPNIDVEKILVQHKQTKKKYLPL
ncbi:MAG: NAD(P)/FAD-dependent oxidoreductase, partial [Elusimicrobiaceae bacterium]|nr:NAD(P)/FAD-dependent oxidoreductase [Elusimicrobiaceae bacterium]